MINSPHALYYNGELVGIITNPDPLPGGVSMLSDLLNSGEWSEVADLVTIPTEGNLRDPGDKSNSYDTEFLWSEIEDSLRRLHVTETIEPTESE